MSGLQIIAPLISARLFLKWILELADGTAHLRSVDSRAKPVLRRGMYKEI